MQEVWPQQQQQMQGQGQEVRGLPLESPLPPGWVWHTAGCSRHLRLVLLLAEAAVLRVQVASLLVNLAGCQLSQAPQYPAAAAVAAAAALLLHRLLTRLLYCCLLLAPLLVCRWPAPSLAPHCQLVHLAGNPGCSG
jgi:hypothetical protein